MRITKAHKKKLKSVIPRIRIVYEKQRRLERLPADAWTLRGGRQGTPLPLAPFYEAL
jgi:hypothetical protein